MMRLFVALPAISISAAGAGSIPLATFDGAKATTLQWQTVDDPVMGGRSKSAFKLDEARHVGVWSGEVAIVPFLKSPGFCNLQSPGLHKTADFPDLSSCDGIIVRAREVEKGGLIAFNVMLMAKGAKHLWQQGVYSAGVNFTDAMSDQFVPWSAFTCTWRGQSVSWCPKITTQLKLIDSIGLGTYFPGTAGKFSIEIESMSGRLSGRRPHEAMSIDLATFDGKAVHKWHSENDPVMGGQSSSSVNVKDGYADYSGTTRIVPALKAPGFTIAMTGGFPMLSKFPDVSSMDGLTVELRQVGTNFTGFKIAFCDSHLTFYRSDPSRQIFRCQVLAARSFKKCSYPGRSFLTSGMQPRASTLQRIRRLPVA
eukprot:TRINITY_DN23278_c0_g1_i1.p1 TRINITY_DN23278_c0_g1~~TRINITY_DN23278_c0_g1_i1.p1  ORF type:complete len:367 (+),score=53.94 TRINITY_DN23278_c0_g1_i1:114-1214(+)